MNIFSRLDRAAEEQNERRKRYDSDHAKILEDFETWLSDHADDLGRRGVSFRKVPGLNQNYLFFYRTYTVELEITWANARWRYVYGRLSGSDWRYAGTGSYRTSRSRRKYLDKTMLKMLAELTRITL
jgi:hypothetical protein